MKHDQGETRTQRRKFLRNVATAGGLAVVAGSAGRIVAATPSAPAKAPTKGYRVTAHISKYYDKARI